MAKIRYGRAEVVKEQGSARLLKFRGRYYTAFGRMFAVSGNFWDRLDDPDFNLSDTGRHYAFCDWENLYDMFEDD